MGKLTLSAKYGGIDQGSKDIDITFYCIDFTKDNINSVSACLHQNWDSVEMVEIDGLLAYELYAREYGENKLREAEARLEIWDISTPAILLVQPYDLYKAHGDDHYYVWFDIQDQEGNWINIFYFQDQEGYKDKVIAIINENIIDGNMYFRLRVKLDTGIYSDAEVRTGFYVLGYVPITV